MWPRLYRYCVVAALLSADATTRASATRFRISLPARQFTFTYSFHNTAQFDYTKALIVAIANPKVVR